MTSRNSRAYTRFLIPLALLALLTGPGSVVAEESSAPPAMAAANLVGHARKLASDEWEGRGSGSEGERQATDYIAEHLRGLGLEPAGEEGTFFQTVAMAGATRLGKNCLFELSDQPPGFDPFVLDRDYRPFVGSAAVEVEGELVFAGYGVHAPELGYDDYAGLDVRGKVVAVFRHLPRGGGAWASGKVRTQHAPFRAKLKQATDRGAVALLLMNDPANFPTKEEAKAAGKPKRRPRPDTLEKGQVGAGHSKIVFMHLTRAAGSRLLALGFGTTVEDVENEIANEGKPKPASRAKGGRVHLRADLETQQLLGRNVLGLLRAGAEDAGDEILVVGAHHDHLGRGMRGSLARKPAQRKQIHNGADDNASGTAGLLEVARHLASRRNELRRSVLLMTFTGEERGLLGSAYFCAHPTVPFDKVAAMINMDMIGRLEGRQLFIGGVKTSPIFEGILSRRAGQLGLATAFGEGGRAPSDNTSFYNKGKPVLFFFTGMHPDYHRPSDDWEKLDGDGLTKVASLAAWVAEDLARSPEPIPFQRADSGGFGPPRAVLGIGIAPAEGGVRIESLVANGPASQAGLLVGDVIVELAGTPTPDPAALRAVMRKRKIGELVTVVALREGERVTVDLKLARG